MAYTKLKNIKSKYKHVIGLNNNTTGSVGWIVNMYGVGRNCFETEREAAIAVDKLLIKKGQTMTTKNNVLTYFL